ncbi:MAG: putative quinol monooxygenase [Devosia sp.]
MSERIVRLAELEIDPAQLAAYRALLAEEIAASVAKEPGVLLLNAVAMKDAPHQIRILEIYADRAAYEAHLITPHFLKYKAGTAAMVVSLRLIDAEPVAIAGKDWAAILG